MASGQQDQALMPVGGSGGLMLPPAPRPPTKRKVAVLDEDEYTANLESIIERDFFPELSKLESKVAWLQVRHQT
jgi:protein DGCR14